MVVMRFMRFMRSMIVDGLDRRERERGRESDPGEVFHSDWLDDRPHSFRGLAERGG